MRTEIVAKMILLSLSMTVVLFVQASICDDKGDKPAVPADLSGILALLQKHAAARQATTTTTEATVAAGTMDLLREYAKNYTTPDTRNPFTRMIADWIEVMKASDDSEGKSESDTPPVADSATSGSEHALDFSLHDDHHHDDHHDDTSAVADIITDQSLSTGWGSDKKEEWTWWDWITSDGARFGIILAIFGIVPIVLGLVPYIYIAVNYWWLFNRFYNLHHAFWSALGHHHDDSYGWSHYSDEGWNGWTGWTANGWGSRQLQ